MRFSSERKKAIRQYILSKVCENKEGLSRSVAETFGIGISTVHTYINELLQEDVIVKRGRDRYALTKTRFLYTFARSRGEIESESYLYEEYLLPIVRDLADNVQAIWSYAFSEMVNNVIDHSAAEHLWIVIEKSMVETGVYIMDDGVGIFRKIREHFGYRTADDAIIELSKGKLTTDSDRHSGEGIFFTSRIMDEFLLYSDRKVFSFNKYREEAVGDIEKEYPFSTCVYLSLANGSKKRLPDLFCEYADVDNGFVKTRIPLKNIFESAPVSRSQAKRICSRLEQFREVEFDFSGVDFVGQGFAHEVFFVYAKAHPDVCLIPLHMNDAVRNMIAHVSAAGK